ncbi:MAG: DUF4168 domain-containing protein [Aulosira sp. ZfuVER01]|nr:DUF4168 domain-containing protein [Aulosira sp. ZfuVER01]MDZ8002903.1 DUF4168 domain-containing protein [Aulosira sp. DedVER01a]MDZ8053584.1 DUF4168 domain-containing protein [Aulosira sp. ZfuCHP01]
MKKIADLFFQRKLQHILSQALSYSAIATAGIVASVIISGKVNAQTPQPVNSNEIISYAQAVLAMEPARQQAFDEIKKLMGDREIPKIVCNDSKSISGLPKKAQDIAVNYCKHSQKIVEENGLTIERFNKITVDLQNDNDLKQKISNTLILIQNPAKKP